MIHSFAGWMGLDHPKEQSTVLLSNMTQDATLKSFTGQGYALAARIEIPQQRNYFLTMAGRSDVLPALLDAYQRDGVAGLLRTPPASALALLDTDRQTLLLVTDPIGLSNLYYAQISGGIVFGTHADFLVRHPEVSDDIDPQTLYDYVYYHHCPSPNSIYKQVKKLEGGECLIYEKGQIRLQRYWMPDFQESKSHDLQSAGHELQALLIDSVKQCVGNEDDTGAFLSGGLDSSSVAGALSQVFPGKARTFSMGFPVEGYNEIEYAHIAVKHFNTRQHEYYVTPEDTVNAVPMIAAYYDEPFGNSSALAAYYCGKLAKENGIRRLLAGDGGDEIFAGNERYAKQMLFEHYHRLPAFASNALEAGLKHLPAGLARQKLLFKAKRYIEQAKAPMPDRLQDYNFLHRHEVATIFEADFLAQVDTQQPLALLRECYERPEQASVLNRMLYMDWKTTLHDNDLVKVNRMCELAGVEVAYPLLDQRIVDLSCRIASSDKLRGQKLRWFYKQAMADFLPDAIINKSKHGFGLPFGIWLKDHQPLQTMAYDAIHDLKKRGYFKPSFLDHAIQMHQSVHAAYYGELIWILMMLELWFVGKGR